MHLRSTFALLALALAAPPALAQPADPIVPGVYRFTGVAGGHRHEGLLRVEPLAAGDEERFAVTHVVHCQGRRVVLEGVGRRSASRPGAPRLAVRFESPGLAGRLDALGADEGASYGAYQLGPTLLLGVLRAAPCAGGAPEWLEERGPARPVAASSPAPAAARPLPASASRTPPPAPSPAPTAAIPPPPAPSTPTPGGSAPPAALLSDAVEVARRELAAGVREQGGRNRGPRIDHYAQVAGMAVGQAWCGFFTGFCYTEAARGRGREFAGRTALHSVEKARAFFLYRSYTQTWTATRIAAWEADRARHGAEPRRFFVLRGSSGHEYAARHRLAAEVVDDYRDLPIGPGDTVLWDRSRNAFGHLGLVERYDPASGVLTTIEGNNHGAVRRATYALSDPAVRARFDGFGRPAGGDL